jgi:disulfide bond formation protein DsbB
VTPLYKAKIAAFLLPAGLLAGAFGSEYLGGLYPCEMCYWQRWPHEAAVMLAILAYAARKGLAENILLILAALAVIVSGAIGVFHAGVEYGWWQGLTQCARIPASGGGDFMKDIMATPLVRCDQPQWTFAGISLAGYNAILSIGGGVLILHWMRKAMA